jgi:ABC-type glycerol-3-phosphate transport system substrate-binding protein
LDRASIAFWWWGEDEAPGLGAWLSRAVAGFEAEHGVVVELRRLRHDEVLPGFPAAVAERRQPDLHFFWNGIYLMDNVWRGYVAPLDELLDPAVLAAIGGGPLSTWEGRTYRVGWYVIPVVWVANRDVLEASGVTRVPAAWPDLVEACARVRTAGYRPITAGDGEGDVGVWWLTHFLTQDLDEPADVVRLALGEVDWREARYRAAWDLLAEARRNGFFDEEALPLTLWQGLDRFGEGQSAFTLASGPMLASCRRALGEAATAFVAPRSGSGRLAGLPVVDTQGIGVSAASREPGLAAAFLAHLHGLEHRAALWEDVRLFPADRRWAGPGEAADPDYRRLWEWYARGPSAPYVPDLVPLELHYGLAGIGQGVLAGRLDGAAAGAEAQRRSLEWARADPERTAVYRAWALGAAGT